MGASLGAGSCRRSARNWRSSRSPSLTKIPEKFGRKKGWEKGAFGKKKGKSQKEKGTEKGLEETKRRASSLENARLLVRARARPHLERESVAQAPRGTRRGLRPRQAVLEGQRPTFCESRTRDCDSRELFVVLKWGLEQFGHLFISRARDIPRFAKVS